MRSGFFIRTASKDPSKNRRKRAACAAAFFLAFFQTDLFSASLRELDFPFTFRAESPVYKVRTYTPASRPGFLVFEVGTPRETQRVETLPELRKRLHEIEVIELIRRGKAGSGFGSGVGDSFVSTGEGLKNLVTDPAGSGRALGAAAAKIGRGIGGLFQDKDEAESMGFDETVFGGAEREIARQLGVDVYTRNQELRALIQGMARARTGGAGAAFVGKVFIPGGIAVSAVVGAGTVNGLADEFISSKSRADLYAANRQAYENLGFPDEPVRRLLGLPFFSPRETTYLRFYIEALKEAAGYREIFRKASELRSLWEARELLYASQLAAEAVRVLPEYTVLGLQPEGVTLENGGRLYFFVPYDLLDGESEVSTAVLARVKKLRLFKTFRGAEIRTAGQALPAFEAQASRQGCSVRDWMLYRSFMAGSERATG